MTLRYVIKVTFLSDFQKVLVADLAARLYKFWQTRQKFWVNNFVIPPNVQTGQITEKKNNFASHELRLELVLELGCRHAKEVLGPLTCMTAQGIALRGEVPLNVQTRPDT